MSGFSAQSGDVTQGFSGALIGHLGMGIRVGGQQVRPRFCRVVGELLTSDDYQEVGN